ncbi:MAG: hypothetical protein K2P27_08065, partial [Lachnospiraceae bacterium]|nr:hypothetical protein [Lachnospiraceae bacterium]
AIGQARFLRNREVDMRGNVEQTLRYIVNEMDTIGWKDEIPHEMQGLFTLSNHEFLDTGSVRYPRKPQTIKKQTMVELEEMTEEDIEKARAAHEKEAYDPYAKEKMKEYLQNRMHGKKVLSCEDLPFRSKRDLLCVLSAIAYSEENGYCVQLLDGYLETDQMLLRSFEIMEDKK